MIQKDSIVHDIDMSLCMRYKLCFPNEPIRVLPVVKQICIRHIPDPLSIASSLPIQSHLDKLDVEVMDFFWEEIPDLLGDVDDVVTAVHEMSNQFFSTSQSQTYVIAAPPHLMHSTLCREIDGRRFVTPNPFVP